MPPAASLRMRVYLPNRQGCPSIEPSRVLIGSPDVTIAGTFCTG
jgi:hypothetical protein